MSLVAAAVVRPSGSQVPLSRLTLVLGGARSGKSRFAERLVAGSGLEPVYLATGTAGDAEMAARIADHRAARGPGWVTIEEPVALAAALKDAARMGRAVIVDCLTLWLSNLMLGGHDVARAAADLAATLPRLGGPVVLVANEVGMGIVPDNPLARVFRDHAGRLNQAIAAMADRVVLVAAGLPLVLKEERSA